MDATDTTALLGTIGTWIAVILALAALIGIVGPWAVYRALHSERTIALNFVHDSDPNPFISRGWGFGRQTRLFRTIRVPDFTPYEDWSRGADLVIATERQLWIFKDMQPTKCRTGWARFCRLVEAYKVQEGKVNARQENVKVRKGGDLVIEDGETWLPVSAGWILALGLLGRYGSRVDNGMDATFKPNALRPDSEEQRIPIDDSYPPRRATQGRPPSSASSSSSSLSTYSYPTTVWGATGSFKLDAKKRSRGNEYGGSKHRLRFISNLKKQTGGLPDDSTATSIPLLYWLAAGFMPLRTEGSLGSSTVEVACLQDPAISIDNAFNHEPMQWRTFELDETKDMPASLNQTLLTFGLGNASILSFQEKDHSPKADPSEANCINAYLQGRCTAGESKWIAIPPELITIYVTGELQEEYELPSYLVKRADIQLLLNALLDKSWHPWSYLISKQDCLWTRILEGLADIFWNGDLMTYGISISSTLVGLDLEFQQLLAKVSSWRNFSDFHQKKLADLLALRDYLLKHTNRQGSHPTRVIGVISATFVRFRRLVKMLLSQKALHSSTIVATIDNSVKKLTWHFIDMEDNTDSESQSEPPMRNNPQCSPEEEEEFFKPIMKEAYKERMRELAAQRRQKDPNNGRPSNDVFIETKTSEGTTWIKSPSPESPRPESHQPEIPQPQSPSPSTIPNRTLRAPEVFQLDIPFPETTTASIIELTAKEVILAYVLAATQCALWTSSIDSKALMDFVDSLTDVVLVS